MGKLTSGVQRSTKSVYQRMELEPNYLRNGTVEMRPTIKLSK